MPAIEPARLLNLARRTKTPAQSRAGPESLFPTGVQVLHCPDDATTDVCFVHGLMGNRRTTWTAEGQPAPWPGTILPPMLPGARILTYGYNANVTPGKSPVSTNRVADHARNLLVDLTNARAGAAHRPLIFVAHSLGGIVVKEAVLASRDSPEPHLRAVFERAAGIAFLGTPHKGSSLASWARIPAAAMGLRSNKSLLEVLETDDQLLGSIQERFWSMVREQREAGRRLGVACFREELPVSGVGMVVSRESATLEGYPSISIQADHRQMTRFASAEDNGFLRLLGELTRWSSPGTGTVTPTGTPLGQVPEEACFRQIPPGGHAMTGHGSQFNAPGGTQNINNGSGNQFLGVTFNGPVNFGTG